MKCYTQVYVMNSLEAAETYCKAFGANVSFEIKNPDKTLGFHIPSSGIPLTDEVRLDSYKKAYEFFKDYRREDGLMIFECGSWLLWDGYKEFLPAKSNILKIQLIVFAVLVLI